jgi:hypothetical protein
MAFSVKQWLNKPGSGTSLDAPSEAARTHLDAIALRDLEKRLSDYTDSQGGGVVVTQPGDPAPTTFKLWIKRL